jgi:glycosyltransferase involved in cell wall biosynthesis
VSRPPRVLHFIYDDPANPWVAGGGAVRVFELYRRLTAEVDVTVVTGRYPGSRDGSVEGVRYRRVGASSPYAWSRLTYAAAANRLLRRESYDAAIFDFSSYTPIFVPRQRPVGITVHHLTTPTAVARWGRAGGAVVAGLERRMLRRARAFTATSSATLEALRGLVGAVPSIDLVHAGVPDDLFELPRAEAGYVLYFGRLDIFQKGIDTLIEAFAIVAASNPAARLRIAGRGKDAEAVRGLVMAANLSDRVEIRGSVSESERRALLAGATVQVMPSRFEGFGMVAAEAMAAGVPLVATRAGSLPEVVDAPAGGILVPPSDPAALAAALDQLLRDRAARDRLSRTARGSAERFRWEAVAARHLDFIARIAAGETGPPS